VYILHIWNAFCPFIRTLRELRRKILLLYHQMHNLSVLRAPLFLTIDLLQILCLDFFYVTCINLKNLEEGSSTSSSIALIAIFFFFSS
jgi:hypothetical protein